MLSAGFGTAAGLSAQSIELGAALTGGQAVQATLAAGFKLDRVVGLVTLAFNDVTESASSQASVLVGPEVQIAVARSDDRRVELLLDLGISFGHLFGSATTGEGPSDLPSNLLLGYQLGLGGRYWFHRQFALQALSGFAGQAFIPLEGNSGNVSAHGILGSLNVLTVF